MHVQLNPSPVALFIIYGGYLDINTAFTQLKTKECDAVVKCRGSKVGLRLVMKLARSPPSRKCDASFFCLHFC